MSAMLFADCGGIVADDDGSRSHMLVASSYGGPVDLRLRISIASSGIAFYSSHGIVSLHR